MEVAHVVSLLLNAVMLLAVGGVGWAIRTVNQNKERTTVLETQMAGKADKTDVLENYVRRNDYVTQTTLIGAKLDGMADRLARMDERLKHGGG